MTSSSSNLLPEEGDDMTATTDTRTRARRSARPTLLAPDSASLAPDSASLAPVSARDAVGRSTGIEPVAIGVARSPLWTALGIAGLVSLIAAGSLPLIADLLSVPL
jgi:hypothetical protein